MKPAIPCLYEGCSSTLSRMNALGPHLKLVHGINNGFGCEFCGMTDGSLDIIVEHRKTDHECEKPPKKDYNALAHFYRSEYQRKNANILQLQGSLFNKKRKRVTEETEEISEQDFGYMPQDSFEERPQLRPAGEAEQWRCDICKVSFTSASTQDILQHLRENHKVMIYRNPTQAISKYLNMAQCIEVGVKHSPFLELEETGADKELNSEPEAVDPDKALIKDDVSFTMNQESSETSRTQEGLGDIDTSTKESNTRYIGQNPLDLERTLQGDEDDIKNSFFNCIEESAKSAVRSVLTGYETRILNHQKYRVSKKIDRSLDLEPGLLVYAKWTRDGWCCQVPQCFATLKYQFAIDIHMHAHGPSAPLKLYCGEPKCPAGKRGFCSQTRSEMKQHIDEAHRSSPYSFRAVRYAPLHDVLRAYIAEMLLLQDNPRLTTDPLNLLLGADSEKGVLTNRQIAALVLRNRDEIHLVPRRRLHKLLDSRLKTFGKILEETWKSHEDQVDEPRLRRYLQDGFIFMSDEESDQADTNTMPPLVSFRCIILNVFGGYTYTTRDGAKQYVSWYRDLCGRFQTEDPLFVKANLLLKLSRPLIKQNEGHALENSCENDIGLLRDSDSDKLPKYKVEGRHCPWLDCNYGVSKKNHSPRTTIADHILMNHLGCFRQCPEVGCGHCAYRWVHDLEIHRQSCHIGMPFQCGHFECNLTYINDVRSRGHSRSHQLQKHFQWHFEKNLLDQGNLGVRKITPNERSTVAEPAFAAADCLPSETDYQSIFRRGSTAYFSKSRHYRKTENERILGRNGVRLSDCNLIGQKTCAGFWFGDRKYHCVDLVRLDIDTAMLIFVNGLFAFTLAETCDYCIHAMSMIHRPKAPIPLSQHFDKQANTNKSAKRRGVGAQINGSADFRRFCQTRRLTIPPMGVKVRDEIGKNARNVFIVDFESTYPIRGTSWPLEVSVLDGNGIFIVKGVIVNEPGMTNAEFEASLNITEDPHNRIINSIRRIRGDATSTIPDNVMTPQQILQTLKMAGFGPGSFWIEYSVSGFDSQRMKTLIEMAGARPETILPPSKSHRWWVITDFRRALPGLADYKLGTIGKLVVPDNRGLKDLHRSINDVTVLFDFVQKWLFTYGVVEST